MKRNINLYKFYVVFSQALFIWPIQILFFQEKGLNFTEIMIISSITSIIEMLMEIPSGMIADRAGYKKTVLLGLFLTICGYIVLLVSASFGIAVVYGICLACGEALISGADIALLYESHVLEGTVENYGDTIRTAGSLKMFSLAGITLVSGYTYKINPSMPYVLSIIMLAAAFCVVLSFKEVMGQSEGCKVRNDLHVARKTFCKNKKMRNILIIGIMFSLLFLDANYFMQQYMNVNGIDVIYFGVIFFICNMISAICFKYSKKIQKFLENKTMIIMDLLLIIIFLIASCVTNYVGVLFLCFIRVSIAVVNPLLNIYINENISSGERATMLSVYNAIISVVFAVFDPIIGICLDNYGINRVYLILMFIAIILFCVLLRFKANDVGVK